MHAGKSLSLVMLLATALAEGCDEKSALRFACAAASLSTSRMDTLPSYHRRAEVDQLL